VYHHGGTEDGAAVFLTLTVVDIITGNTFLQNNSVPQQRG
jgi:hypothetical protein